MACKTQPHLRRAHAWSTLTGEKNFPNPKSSPHHPCSGSETLITRLILQLKTSYPPQTSDKNRTLLGKEDSTSLVPPKIFTGRLYLVVSFPKGISPTIGKYFFCSLLYSQSCVSSGCERKYESSSTQWVE